MPEKMVGKRAKHKERIRNQKRVKHKERLRKQKRVKQENQLVVDVNQNKK